MLRRTLLPLLALLLTLAAGGDASGARRVVELPGAMQAHMLANMRDHLAAIEQITALLAEARYEAAGEMAEDRLGMSSLQRHGAHQMGQHMPEGMRAIGTAMHRAASRLALAAGDAEVTGDPSVPLAALSAVMAQCVACHNGYRLR